MKNSFFQHAACEWQVIILDDQQSNHICIALKQSVTSSSRGVLRLAARLEGADITTVLSEGRDWFPELGMRPTAMRRRR